MSNFRCRWCGAYTANTVDLQMHLLDCQLVNNDVCMEVTPLPDSGEVESTVENSQVFNIFMQEMEKEESAANLISPSSDEDITSVSSSDDFITTDEDGDEDVQEVMKEYSIVALDTDEEDKCNDNKEKVEDTEEEDQCDDNKEKVEEQEKKEGIERTTEDEQEKEDEKEGKGIENCDYVRLLQYLDGKEKEEIEIEKVVCGARQRITELEEKMARYHKEMKIVNNEFEEEKEKMIRIVMEKHEEIIKKNESIKMMEEVINGMTTDLSKSNSLLKIRNTQLQERETELEAQNREIHRLMKAQKIMQEELSKVKSAKKEEDDNKCSILERELEEKEDKIKLLEKNLSQVMNEKTRMKNENKVMKKKEGEEEINLQRFHQDFQDFKAHVLSELKHKEEEKENKGNSRKKTQEKEMSKVTPVNHESNLKSPPLEEIAPWDVHNNGFASKYMMKQGHQPGKGLGKTANGIVQPVSAERRTFARGDPSDWPRNTMLIAGDSMIGGLADDRMSKKYNIKIRSHPGATNIDMLDHLKPLLRKKPDHLILHTSTNDAVESSTSADDIYDRLIDLKELAESSVPGIKVSLSCPTLRHDDGMANAKLVQVKNRLKRSGHCIIENDNIIFDDVSKKGLHLKTSGTRKLAANMIAYMRSL